MVFWKTGGGGGRWGAPGGGGGGGDPTFPTDLEAMRMLKLLNC